METKSNLEQQTIDKLQDLIRANLDSVAGFEEVAEDVDDTQIAKLFRRLATERSEMAIELQSFVEFNGEDPVEDGSYAASVHRAWINVRSKLNGGDPQVILNEAERGEDHIKEAYEDALKETAGSAMNNVLQAQYAKVKAGHDKVRDLRDSYQSA